MEDEDAIIMGREAAPADELEAAPMQEADALEPELFELEIDGETHALPAALKGAFLRQADYTRKTQELAEHRRAVEAERQALAEQKRALSGASQDRVTLAVLDDQIAAFSEVDWQTLAQAEPERAKALWESFQSTQEVRERYADTVNHRAAREQLEAAREAAEAMSEAGRQLSREIEGWSPEVAAKLVEYGQAFGVTLEEFAQMADPRFWKLLHKAYQADQASLGEARVQAHAVRPAVLVSGATAGGGGVRDELSTREWMRRRNEQMAGDR